jgi:hypothetical protein
MTNKYSGCLTTILAWFLQVIKRKPIITTTQPEILPFRVKDDFLSIAEASFYRVLKTIYGDKLLVFPKVSMGEIFFVSHPEVHYSYFNRINQKRVDFLLCHPQTLKPLLAIELDDASHQRKEREERDEFVNQVFQDAGLPLLHIQAQTSYDTHLLDEQIKMVILGSKPQTKTITEPIVEGSLPNNPPRCPKCGAEMVLRTAKQGSQAGKQFYGCPNFPHCRGVLPVGLTPPMHHTPGM